MAKRTNLSLVFEAIKQGVNLAWQFADDPAKVSHSFSWISIANVGTPPSPKYLVLQSIQNVAFREGAEVLKGCTGNGQRPHPSLILSAMERAFEKVAELGLIGTLAIETEPRDEVAPEWNADRIRYRNSTLPGPVKGFCEAVRAADVRKDG